MNSSENNYWTKEGKMKINNIFLWNHIPWKRHRHRNQHNFIKVSDCPFSYVLQRKMHTCSLPADLLKNLFQVFTVSFVSLLHHALTTDTDENNKKDKDGHRQYDKEEKKPRKMRPWPRSPRLAILLLVMFCVTASRTLLCYYYTSNIRMCIHHTMIADIRSTRPYN